MKRLFFVYAILINISLSVSAQITKTLNFDVKDFSFGINEFDEIIINSSCKDCYFINDVDLPRLPYFPVSFAIPTNCAYKNIETTAEKLLIKDEVILAANKVPVPTMEHKKSLAKKASYEKITYPDSNVAFQTTSISCGYKIISFLACPFKYDAKSKKLFFLPSISLTVNLEESEYTEEIGADNTSDILMTLISNTLPTNEQHSFDFVHYPDSLRPISIFPLEYLIITKESLKNAFQPLCNWKTTKGVKAEIITTEEINTNFSGETMQLKIKNCLKHYYNNFRGLKYVLLGGDDTVVPAFHTFNYANLNRDQSWELNIPTDQFYSCLEGRFDWNANGNNIYGESVDSINYTPSIFVTRAPVRTVNDVNNFVDKILFYEQTPDLNGWNNNMLMAGSEIDTTYNIGGRDITDAEIESDSLYHTSIEPYWNGDKYKFFECYTDLVEGRYNLNKSHFSEQLSNGYTFFDMNCHGNQDVWQLEIEDYTTDDVDNVDNDIPTIIVTESCLSNAFDSQPYLRGDPCLSESFIRKANSSVVAYWGASRTNYSGVSLDYANKFYEYLFSNQLTDKNFGRISAAAKMALAPMCNNNYVKRVQYGLNPIGDPEMPVFTSYPQRFENVRIVTARDSIFIDTGMFGCRICIMSIDDNDVPFYRVFYNQRTVRLRWPVSDWSSLSICITKQNFVPYVKEVPYLVTMDPPVLSPQITSTSSNQTRGQIVINTRDVTDSSNVSFTVCNSTGHIANVRMNSIDTNKFALDFSPLPSGIYFVRMYYFDSENKISQSCNSIKIIKI